MSFNQGICVYPGPSLLLLSPQINVAQNGQDNDHQADDAEDRFSSVGAFPRGGNQVIGPQDGGQSQAGQ